MLITDDNIEEVLLRLPPILSLDTETTGLRPYHGHLPFSVIISDGKESFYFPILQVAGLGESKVLGAKSLINLREFLTTSPRTYFLQNAKFDLHHLYKAGFTLHEGSRILDTMVLARLECSSLHSYSLDNLSQHYLGLSKDDKVADYIREHGLCTGKDWHAEKVPIEIMQPYAEKDALLTYKLGHLLVVKLAEHDIKAPREWPSLIPIVNNESELTLTCFEMEKSGVKIDQEYCKKAIEKEGARLKAAASGFAQATGEEYKPSSKAFEEIFKKLGVDNAERTDKGNPRFDRAVMSKLEHPAAKFVTEAKDAKARLNFFDGFLRHADNTGIVHTNFRQSGTMTGRFASSDPNLQNLTKVKEHDTAPIRRAVVPFDENYCLVSIDYEQMEYRMMLDYAGQMDMIEKVLSGLDVHQATADLVQIPRNQAKTLNFALLYGAGVTKIASMLDLETEFRVGDLIKREPDINAAKRIVRQFFTALPQVEKFIFKVKAEAKRRGYIFNWYGRRVHYLDRNFSYAAPNHLIQGGCADAVKIAMNRCHKLLMGKKSKLSLVIHDELVFNMHGDELDLLPEIRLIMETAYPHRLLPLTVSMTHSWKSLADKIIGPPQVQ